VEEARASVIAKSRSGSISSMVYWLQGRMQAKMQVIIEEKLKEPSHFGSEQPLPEST
jgi:hypothetical protein